VRLNNNIVRLLANKKEGAKQTKTKLKMKKILLLTVCMQVLISCGYASIDTSKLVVITSIEAAGAGKCDYYGQGNGGMTYNIWTSDMFKMRDMCGKFQIGDTITFTKVKPYKETTVNTN
jgi:hypothetical protein